MNAKLLIKYSSTLIQGKRDFNEYHNRFFRSLLFSTLYLRKCRILNQTSKSNIFSPTINCKQKRVDHSIRLNTTLLNCNLSRYPIWYEPFISVHHIKLAVITDGPILSKRPREESNRAINNPSYWNPVLQLLIFIGFLQ